MDSNSFFPRAGNWLKSLYSFKLQGWRYGNIPRGEGVIFNPTIYNADLVPLNRAFWAHLEEGTSDPLPPGNESLQLGGGRSFFENSFFHLIGPKNNSIQNKIQNIHSKNIHSIEYRIINRTIHSKERKIIQNSNKRPKYGFRALHRPLYGSRTPEMDSKGPTEWFDISLIHFFATIFDAGN